MNQLPEYIGSGFVSGSYNHPSVIYVNGKVFKFKINKGRRFKRFSNVQKENANSVKYILEEIKFEREKILFVAGRTSTMLFLTSNNHVYGLGDGGDGTMGMDGLDSSDSKTPILIQELLGIKVISISAFYHSLFLTNTGKCLGCGLNRHWGRIGVGKAFHGKNVTSPTRIKIPNNKRVILAVAWGAFSYYVDDEYQVYAVGRNDYGQCAQGDKKHHCDEVLIVKQLSKKKDSHVRIKQISCGDYRAVFLFNNGNLFVTGQNGGGCFDSNVNIVIPKKVILGEYSSPMKVVAGNNETIVLTKKREVFLFCKRKDKINTKKEIVNVTIGGGPMFALDSDGYFHFNSEGSYVLQQIEGIRALKETNEFVKNLEEKRRKEIYFDIYIRTE